MSKLSTAPPSSRPVLRVENLAKSFGQVKALRGVTFSVSQGEFVVLLGANGAGKSTLIQLLTGLFSPDKGRIEILGHDVSRNAVEALAELGVVFQQQTLDLELSVQANLLYHTDLHGMSRHVAKKRVADALEHFGLTERRRSRARTLSGGNRRRIELARAMLHAPRLILMDEATVGLDPASRQDILTEMIALKEREGVGVLWTTHLIDEVQRADRLIILRQGLIVYDGTWRELMNEKGGDDLTEIVIAVMEKDSAPESAVYPT